MKANILFVAFLLILSIPAFPQKAGKSASAAAEENRKARVEALVNGRNFVFHARMAMPAGGKTVNLTTNRSYVIFTPELIESSLPFFGRANSGVVNDNDTGMNFSGTSEDFRVAKKNKNYQINVSVKGEMDSYRLTLTVSTGGTASLTISSNNRESISYTGEITPPDKNK